MWVVENTWKLGKKRKKETTKWKLNSGKVKFKFKSCIYAQYKTIFMRSFCHLFTSCYPYSNVYCLFCSSKLTIKRNITCVSTYVINMLYLKNFLFISLKTFWNSSTFFWLFFYFFGCFWFKLQNLFPFVCFFSVHVLPNLLRMQNDKLDFDPVYLLYLIHKFISIWFF